MQNTHKIGIVGENLASEYLNKHKYTIIERNFRNRYGEIDIIAKKDGYIIFIEVKSRSNVKYGLPSEAVNKSKQRKIKQVALYYLHIKNLLEYDIRFDVVEVFLNSAYKTERIEIIENAFD